VRQRFQVQPQVLRWIAEGEHQEQDFKLRIDDARKIAKTLSAFSNTSGGRLLIGVKDNGTIAGVKEEEEFYMLQHAAQNHCNPPIELHFQAWKVEDKLILEVNIANATRKPVLAEFEKENWKAFLRDHDQNILAPAVMLDVWKMAESPLPENFQYTTREQLLLNELQNGAQSLTLLCKKTKTKRFILQKILSKLIRWEIVKWKVQGGIAYYYLPS
jgi:predicted HTH transcriptional regulator